MPQEDLNSDQGSQDKYPAVESVPKAPAPVPASANIGLWIAGIALTILLGATLWFTVYAAKTPPDPAAASADEVVSYLSDPRGLPRLSIEDREAYLKDIYQQFSDDQDWAEISRRFREMPQTDMEVFRDALFEICRERFLNYAEKYNAMDEVERRAYLDEIIMDVTTMGRQYGGQVGKAQQIAQPFMQVLPQNQDEMVEYLIQNTDTREREVAQILFQDIIDRVAEMRSERKAARQKRKAQAASQAAGE